MVAVRHLAQIAALVEAVGARYRALVLVAAYGGLRWGELVGLKVKRVELLPGRVTVAEVNGQLIPGPPKTAAGRRTITLPAVAAVALAEHLAEFAEPAPEGLVFPAPRVAICAAPTSAVAGGSERSAPPAWKGCGSMICAIRPRPWPWLPARTPAS